MNTIKSPVPELFIDFSLLYVKAPVFFYYYYCFFFFFQRGEMLVSGLPYKFRDMLFMVRHVESCERIKESSVLTTGL